MKTAIVLVLILFSPSSLLAGENIIDFRLVYENKLPDTFIVEDEKLGKIILGKESIISDSDILEAKVTIDREPPPKWVSSAVDKSVGSFKINEPQIYIDLFFNRRGKEIFTRVTSENIGKRIAVLIYDEIVMAPRIMDKIDSGVARISSGFTEKEANTIVNSINRR